MEDHPLEKIRNRQLARFLAHLKKTGQLTPGLESDVKRAFNFLFQDVESLFDGEILNFGNDKDKKDDREYN